MAIGGAFQELGQFLDECEQMEETVEDVALTDHGTVTADVELTLPVEDDQVSLSPSIEADGTLRVALESVESVVPAADYDVEVEPTDATVGADGTVAVVLTATVADTDTDAGTDGTNDGSTGRSAYEAARAADPAESTTASSDNDLPPFRDPELLASVYDSCDTFAEMADSLDMDVTAETVRRYMIDFDIHQPSSYDTDTGDDESQTSPAAAPGDEQDDADASEPTARAGEDATSPSQQQVVLSDGVGLPDDVTVETLIETVKQSNTICEVRREIDVDHQDALDMLQELNLLDLVVGRLATEAERDITRDEVIGRLREASATKSRP